MKEGGPDFSSRFGHKDMSLRLPAHENRQSSDMIEVRMRNNNCVDDPVGDGTKIREGVFSFVLGVHATIQDKPAATDFQVVTISADFRAASEISKLQSNWAKIRIQFPKRIFVICSSSNPRSINF